MSDDLTGPNRASTALTALMLETFRLNGALLAQGDRLVAPIGLTSARWQVMGAIALAGAPQPVAHIARTMGLTRQAVQRTVDDLESAGLVDFLPNPHHRRAKLVTLTPTGTQSYAQADRSQIAWSKRLSRRLSADQIEDAVRVMRTVLEALREDGLTAHLPNTIRDTDKD